MIADDTIDFVFSFDSLVHAELDVMTAYCEQLVRKLSPGGVAFLHHSNAANGVDAENPNAEGRALSVSSQAVHAVIEKAGGRVLVQEEVNWGSTARTDCLTTFVRGQAYPHIGHTRIENNHFMLEMQIIKAYQSPYY
jgi:hypothetical protein